MLVFQHISSALTPKVLQTPTMSGINDNLFALNTASVAYGIIKLITREGRALYNSGIVKINNKLFECTSDGLYQFLESLSLRAKYYWRD